jgi:hypothetical protein
VSIKCCDFGRNYELSGDRSDHGEDVEDESDTSEYSDEEGSDNKSTVEIEV